MNRDEAKATIKQQLAAYLQDKGINTRKPFICLNPEHNDNHPSMSFDRKRDKVHCFACLADYDTLDLIGIDYGLKDPAEIFNKAYELFNIKIEEGQNHPKSVQHTHNTQDTQSAHDTQDEQEPLKDYSDYFAQCRKGPLKAYEYMAVRGISKEVCRALDIGYDDSFRGDHGTWEAAIIPTSKYSYVARNINPEAKGSARYRKRGPISLFNADALNIKKPIFIVEGEIDALSIIEVGYPVLALGSIANTRKLVKHLKEHPAKGPLIIALDTDESGENASKSLVKELEKLKGLIFTTAKLWGTCKDANEVLTTQGREALKELLEEASQGVKNQVEMEQEALENEQKRIKEEYAKTNAANHLSDFIQGINESINKTAISTGHYILDAVLDGGLYEGLYILGAVSSLGKTTFMMQLADQIAKAGQDVLIFSLEMARSEIMAKSISRLSMLECTYKKQPTSNAKTVRGILNGKRYEKYSQEEREIINTSIRKYSTYASHLYIYEGVGNIGADAIRQIVERHISITGNKPILFIDYLQILAPYDVRATDKQNTDKAVLELKRMSRDHGIPIVAISSLNRENYDKEISMQAFKESGSIEYSSDVLIGLQAKGAGSPSFDINEAKNKNPREIVLRILKNRNGATGEAISYNYYPLFNYFEESRFQDEPKKSPIKR